MTEADWLACARPEEMLAWLRAKKASPRKRRLFAVACCRRRWDLLTDARSRRAVEVSERFADGLATDAERNGAGAEAYQAAAEAAAGERANWADDQTTRAAGLAHSNAAAAAYHAGYADDWEDVRRASEEMARAVAGPAWPAGGDGELLAQAALLRYLFGLLLFRAVEILPPWRTPPMLALANAIYQGRRWEDMPVLGDALKEAGCTDSAILRHCRSPGLHARGCWLIDLLLMKE